jgi:DNA-binding GntR family transcriptional regulator
LRPLNVRQSSDANLKVNRVYRRLLVRLRKGEYRFGDKLSAAEITAEFGVSRQPVMAALSLLQADGLVTIRPQVGCHVAAPAFSEISDFFELFAVSEALLAGLAAQRRPDSSLELLEMAWHKLRAMTDVRTLSPTYGTYIRRFHSAIHEASCAPDVQTRVEAMWSLCDFYLNTARAEVAAEDVEREHVERRQIVDAIRARDRARAEDITRGHILSKLNRIGPGRNFDTRLAPAAVVAAR